MMGLVGWCWDVGLPGFGLLKSWGGGGGRGYTTSTDPITQSLDPDPLEALREIHGLVQLLASELGRPEGLSPRSPGDSVVSRRVPSSSSSLW